MRPQANPWRCPKCGKSKSRFVSHVCSPRAERYYQAYLRAWEFVGRLYNADPVQRYTAADPSWDLPRPSPRLDGTPSLPLLFAAADAAPRVLLLPTLLLRETAAQREGEPGTVKTRTYGKWKTISTFRKQCKCQPGMCTPAALSTQFHSLPWTYTVALDAPPGELLVRVNRFRETGLTALEALCSNPPRLTDPFYIMSIASHVPLRDFDPERPAGLHAHLAVGNLAWPELQSLLSSWGYVSPNAIRRTDPVWKALHYTLSQDPYTGDDLIDSYPSLRHLADYGAGGGLFVPPIFSDSLDGVLTAFRQALRRRLSPAQRPEARRVRRAATKGGS